MSRYSAIYGGGPDRSVEKEIGEINRKLSGETDADKRRTLLTMRMMASMRMQYTPSGRDGRAYIPF